MKILLLGATGRTGQLILAELLANNYDVHCLTRFPEKISANEKTTVFKGDATHAPDLKAAMHGCDAIISALNISRNSNLPWSKLRTPPTYLSTVAQNLITESTLQQHLIICSAWGVAETKKDIPFWFRWLINYSNIKHAYKDHERQELLLNRTYKHTIVRPAGLVNSTKDQKVIESYQNKPKPKITISRKNVAKYMVAALKNEELIGKTVVISS